MLEKILIVEDEFKIVKALRLYLEQAGYAVAAAADGAQALALFRQERPLLVLLDLNLPGQDGLDVCRQLRRESAVPIIMLTARSEEVDKLIGLELGADDYIVKPFSPREVVARVRALLRRASGDLAANEGDGPAAVARAGDLVVDVAAHRAWLGDDVIALTHTEFEILAALVQHSGRVLSRSQLLEASQGIAYEGYERTIDQHIKNLRRKIRRATGQPEVIETVYGVGYRLDPIHLSRP